MEGAIDATELKIGDTFLGWCPQWVDGVINEMAVIDIKGCCIKLKEDNSASWWKRADIIVYEITNREVEKKLEIIPKVIKTNIIDINDVKIGDRLLTARPWANYVWEETVLDIKDRVIQLRGKYSIGWKQKKDIIVLEKLGEDEGKKEVETCPFTADKCSALCKLFKGSCVFERILNMLSNIEENTDEDDE